MQEQYEVIDTFVKQEQLAPFMSVLLAEQIDSNTSIEEIHKRVYNNFNLSSNLKNEEPPKLQALQLRHGFGFYSIYRTEKKPSWIKVEGIYTNIEHHLLISLNIGEYWAFYTSEPERKSEIRNMFQNETLQNILKPIKLSRLHSLFVN
jgi:hypothetical protein